MLLASRLQLPLKLGDGQVHPPRAHRLVLVPSRLPPLPVPVRLPGIVLVRWLAREEEEAGRREKDGDDEDTRTAVGESEGEGVKLDEGKTKSVSGNGNGKTLSKKDGVCQPSPETPLICNLNDAVVEEDVSGLV